MQYSPAAPPTPAAYLPSATLPPLTAALERPGSAKYSTRQTAAEASLHSAVQTRISSGVLHFPESECLE